MLYGFFSLLFLLPSAYSSPKRGSRGGLVVPQFNGGAGGTDWDFQRPGLHSPIDGFSLHTDFHDFSALLGNEASLLVGPMTP